MRLYDSGFVSRMVVTICAAIGVATGAAWGPAEAYELLTHAQMTETAFGRSERLLQYLLDVGITQNDVIDPDREMHDRNRSATESTNFTTYQNDGTVRGWLAAGSIREDDYARHPVLNLFLGCPPAKNPPSPIDRMVNHFFHVQGGGAPLSVPATTTYPAPDWALGVQGRSQNQFTILDARDDQIASLTATTRIDRERKTARLFRSLGQVVHLLQDMAQPQHTRNDAHPLCERVLNAKSWYEEYIEMRAAGRTFNSREVAPLLFTAYGPVGFETYRHFWTNGQFGLADFSSRNFLTAGTNFGARPPCEGESQPPCPPDGSYGIETISYTARTVGGQQVTADIVFFTRDIPDALFASSIPGVRVSSRSLWDEHLERREKAPKYSLNTFNYDSIAEALLPRAVGYTIGLLDYFFRGRLDVDLVDDGNGPALVGRNISGEPLDGGTLRVYADGVGAMDGQRFQASADTEVGLVAHDGALPPVAVTLPPEAAGAERFVAVYKGALGAERPDTGTIGAVIGKVLGGTRVEQLFSDGNRWNIRTPDGIYPLPILNDIQELVWGDADNILVGRTAIGATAPNQFVLYRIDRGPGDPVMPVTATGEVRLLNPNPSRLGLPVNLPIASVSVTQTMRFKQYLPAALHDVVNDGAAVIDPNTETWEFDANLAVNEERQTTRTRDLRLDFNTFQSVTSDGHSWRIENIYGDSNGEIFALITSTLRLRNESQTFPTKKYVDVCGGWPCPTIDGAPAFIPVTLPTSGVRSTFAVLVNVSRGEVRSVTAPSSGGIAQIRLSHTTSHVSLGNVTSSLDLPSFTVREVRRQNGPDGTPVFVQFDDTTFTCSDTLPHFDLGGASIVVGTLEADVPLYVANLEQATGPSRPPAVQSSIRRSCIDAFHNRPPGARVPMMTFPLDRFTFTSDRIDGVLRARADGNRWAVFITKTSAGIPVQHLIRWDPDSATASLRATIPDSSADLISTSTRRATVATESQLIVVPLDDAGTVVSAPADFASASGYIALEPSLIYRPSDGRFYRISPTLQQTALPPPLASSGPLSGSYHTLKLR